MTKQWWYDWQGLNAWLFLKINGTHGPLIDALATGISWIGQYRSISAFCLLYVLVTLFHVRRARGRNLVPTIPARIWLIHLSVMILGYAIAVQLGEHMKDIWRYPRPYVALPAEMVVRIDRVLVASHDWRSFPSGHAVFVATVVTAIWPVLARWLRPVALFFAFLMGLSRISLGVHFPADVVYGWLIGGAVTWAIRVGLRTLIAYSVSTSERSEA